MQQTPYTLPILATGLIAAGTAVHVSRRRRHAVGAREFITVAVAVAVISFAYAGELASSSLSAQLAWLNLRYVGICVAPFAGLALALRWDGKLEWLTPARLVLLGIVPAATLLLAWTNEWHFIVQGPSELVDRGMFALRKAESRAGFWIFLAHAYACLVVVCVIYGRALFTSPLRRRQGAFMLVATLLPLASNILYHLGAASDPLVDLSSIGYAAACLLWTWTLGRERLFDLVPVARDEVLDSMPDPLVVLDAEGRTIDANPAARALFGHESALLLGVPADALLTPPDARALLERGALELSIRGRTFDARAARIATKTGATGTVLMLRDVSEERRAQRERDLALEAAVLASRARGDFLARMSHEVRTPLHAVLGAADLLGTAGLPPDAQRYVSAIESSSRALLGMVDELLDFSRIDADRIEVEIEDCDARRMLVELVVAFEPVAKKKGLELRGTADGPALVVSADRARLRQILVNFVGNAIKYTSSGAIELRVVPDGDAVRFEVEDSGIGIPESELDTLFVPFRQVQAAPRDGVGGVGLGLAIARQLAVRMHGSVGVSSVEGRGSTFWLRLPAGRAVTPEVEASSRDRVASPNRSGRVLVVDDHALSRFVTVGLLEREGCTALGVEDAEVALRELRRADFALVITDIRMPEMDGHTFARAVHAMFETEMPSRRCPPIVAVTAEVTDGARERALAAGMVDWLSKPIDVVLLRRVLDRWSVEARPDGPSRSELLEQEELLAMFREMAPRDLEDIRASARGERWDEVAYLSHRLKGAAMLVGARDLATTCEPLARGSREQALVDALEVGYRVFTTPAASAREEDAVR